MIRVLIVNQMCEVAACKNQNDELKDAKSTVQSHSDGQETFWSVYLKSFLSSLMFCMIC